MKVYEPKPIFTENIEVGKEVEQLAELLAKNTHEIWAKGKLAEGWKYGEILSEAKKTHPCLVAYEELTETEKDYDRRTSIETLKVMMFLGYKITKKK